MTRKQEWTVVRNNDRKEILTPFGLLSYTRSYYRHKESKEYCYLVDEKAGITPSFSGVFRIESGAGRGMRRDVL